VVPVGYRYDAEAAIDIWGLRLERSKKWGIWSRNGWALGSAGAGFASAPTG
jgi:hypothetical protein